MVKEWFVRRGEKIVGPLTGAKLKELGQAKRIAPTDQVGNSSNGPWSTASNVKGLFPSVTQEETKDSVVATNPVSIQRDITPTVSTPPQPIEESPQQSSSENEGEQWTIRRTDGQEFGPYSMHELLNFASQAKMPLDTLVRCDTQFEGQWVAVTRVPELHEAMTQTQSLQSASLPQQSVSAEQLAFDEFKKKRVPAFLFAWFLLGPMGTHKFYLGQTTPGIIMAIISSIGIAGSCFLFPLALLAITATIATVEGVIYLTKSEDEFARIYLVEKRQWF